MKELKVRTLAIASIMFVIFSITPISMAYAQNTTSKSHVEEPGYSTKVQAGKSADSTKQNKNSITPAVVVPAGTLSLDAYNMAPRLPLTMEADYTATSLIGPFSYVDFTIYFDDGTDVQDAKNVWQWFNDHYSNAIQHKFPEAGEHHVSVGGIAYVNAGLGSITYPLESTSQTITAE